MTSSVRRPLIGLGLGLALFGLGCSPSSGPGDGTPTPGNGQAVTFAAADGLVVHGSVVGPSSGSSRGVVVLAHQLCSDRAEWSQASHDWVTALAQRGVTTVAIDLRGHGQSSDARLSFGINEHRDILGAVDWLRAQGYPAGSIGVLGVSLGGVSAILAAAREPAIGATVSDCAFAELAPLMRDNFTRVTRLPVFMLSSARIINRLVDGYDLLDLRPADEVAQVAPRPLLLIHGDADRLVPLAHAYTLHAAYPQSELWVLPGVRHAAAFVSNPEAYVDHVATFFARSLTN